MKSIHKSLSLLSVFLLLSLIAVNIFHVSASEKDECVKQEAKEKAIKFEDFSLGTVVLDAGHGGYDSGSESNDGSVYEKDITLKVTLLVGEYLENHNVKVVYTRESDQVSWPSDNIKDLESRIKISNQHTPGLFLSLHMNSYESNDVSGYETWIDANNKDALRFVDILHQQIDTLAYTKNRGMKDVNLEPLQIISDNSAPSALLEMGYITSSQDLAFLNNEDSQQRLAEAIGKAIVVFYQQ